MRGRHKLASAGLRQNANYAAGVPAKNRSCCSRSCCAHARVRPENCRSLKILRDRLAPLVRRSYLRPALPACTIIVRLALIGTSRQAALHQPADNAALTQDNWQQYLGQKNIGAMQHAFDNQGQEKHTNYQRAMEIAQPVYLRSTITVRWLTDSAERPAGERRDVLVVCSGSLRDAHHTTDRFPSAFAMRKLNCSRRVVGW